MERGFRPVTERAHTATSGNGTWVVHERATGSATILSMKARVLVVDDDPALAEMLTIVLRGEGFDTVPCPRCASSSPTSCCST